MSLFPLANRKQIPVVVAGATFVVYEPSAIDRCEYFRIGCDGLKSASLNAEVPPDDADNTAKAEYYAHSWVVSKLNRTQTAFLIAACLKPGQADMPFDELLNDVKALPDDDMNTLANAAIEVAGIKEGKA